ncbi:unnamed protein product [Meganyctiphanes norvegica]|uniref:Uncharacterized protein n=1 Tax=Meganyctiphanes norvegica TaxID=48144 RepID=A0AAV2R793_MEGNR
MQVPLSIFKLYNVRLKTFPTSWTIRRRVMGGQTEDVMCQSSDSLGLQTQPDDHIDDQISLERLTPDEGISEDKTEEQPFIEEKTDVDQDEKNKKELDMNEKTRVKEKSSLVDTKNETYKVADKRNKSPSENKLKDPKKTKKPPKKVQKLHNLTSDLLFQAKCLEQALVTKHGLDQQRGDSSGQATLSTPQRGLRGRSSLRIAGDGSVIQRRKQRASATRTWSSIEAIASPQGSSNSIYGGDRGEEGSNPRRDPNQELLAMNAELSRMAKELRFEMMRMWSFRDSTSPESECSETRDERSTMEDLPDICHTETDKLVAEAREVFQSIASLQKEESPPIDLPAYKIKTPSRTSSSSSKSSRRKESFGRRQKSLEDRNKRSLSPANKKMKNCRDDGNSYQEDNWKPEIEPSDYYQEESPLSMVLSSGSTLEEMLLRNENESMVQKKASERRRSSDAISTVTSGPSRSHSPSPSITSSPETERASFHYDDDVSLSGTWRTSGTNSTLRSGEHMLSSSFEWEDEAESYTHRPRAKWKTLKEEEEEGEDCQGGQTKVSIWENKEEDERRKYVTEVTKAKARLGELRTRRISDTQVEYDGHHNKDECFAYTFSHTVYDDEALTAGRVSRKSSMRRADSKEAQDISCRRSRTQPPFLNESCLDNIKAADVFVKTKRTLFTVQGSSQGSDQARATPTFMQSQDEEAESPSESSHERIGENDNNSFKDLSLIECQSKTKDSVDQNDEAIKSSNIDVKVNKNTGETPISLQDIKIKNNSKDDINCSEIKEIDHKVDEKERDQERVSLQDKFPSSISEEALDIMTALPQAGRSPRTSRQLSPALVTPSSITVPLEQKRPTSPSSESKRKVLEAANEGVPAIRNIIQMFNQRITENQELLSNPFRMQSPPTSPSWQSPRTGRKVYAGGFTSREESEDRKTPQHTGFTNPGSGVQKSYSTSVILPAPDLGNAQRSASSSIMEGRPRQVNTTLPEACFPLGISQSAAASLWEMSPPSSPPYSPVPTDTDTSYDLDVSLDDSLLHEQRTSMASGIEKSSSGCLRAIKIKKAREEFLSRGGGLTAVGTERLSGYEPVHYRQRSGTTSTEESWRNSGEMPTPISSPTNISSPIPSEENFQNITEGQEETHRSSSKRRNIPKKEESFRRQSAGCLSETKSSSPVPEVIKSSSSGVLIKNKKYSKFSSETDVQSKSNPSPEASKPARGIFKLFRRHKDKDQKDLNVVQRLCRQSLAVEVLTNRNSSRSGSKSVTPQPDPVQQEALHESLEGAGSIESSRSSKTLPRGSSEHPTTSAPSRSCPSSPVAHRSRTSNWITRGKHMFKSRSPSPSKKNRSQR